MAEITSPLIKKGQGIKGKAQFDKQFNECQVKLAGIRQKNDFIQKTSDNDLDKDIIGQIKTQGELIQVLYLNKILERNQRPEQQNQQSQG